MAASRHKKGGGDIWFKASANLLQRFRAPAGTALAAPGKGRGHANLNLSARVLQGHCLAERVLEILHALRGGSFKATSWVKDFWKSLRLSYGSGPELNMQFLHKHLPVSTCLSRHLLKVVDTTAATSQGLCCKIRKWSMSCETQH